MRMIKLFRTTLGIVVEQGKSHCLLPQRMTWDQLVEMPDLLLTMQDCLKDSKQPLPSVEYGEALAPIVSQEVWAAGVTYIRSREARVQEARTAGAGAAGGDFYERVYSAERPELFFKATPHRVVGTGGKVRIRADAKWSVPEPELALLINSRGRIVGYTIANDMSSRDIEGENPLYLPQAKVYDGSCALGPCVLVANEELPRSTEIALNIHRAGKEVLAGRTSLSQMKRGFQELVDYLFRDNSFPAGCFLLTGTGVVPPDSFTLNGGDEIAITIEPIGTLRNTVA
jgi:2-dehydro-3-deoxy-D-arabinonate dehydratase